MTVQKPLQTSLALALTLTQALVLALAPNLALALALAQLVPSLSWHAGSAQRMLNTSSVQAYPKAAVRSCRGERPQLQVCSPLQRQSSRSCRCALSSTGIAGSTSTRASRRSRARGGGNLSMRSSCSSACRRSSHISTRSSSRCRSSKMRRRRR